MGTGKSIFTDERGYILGMVMIFFVIFSIMGMAFIKMSGHERVHAFKQSQKLRAFYHAEGGIQKGIWLVNKVSNAAATYSDSTVNVTYDSVGLVMVARGLTSSVQDSVRVTLEHLWPYVLYTNTGKLELKIGTGTVTGDLHSNDAVDIDYGDYTVEGTVTEGSPSVNPPTIDWTFFQNEATSAGQYVTGNKNFIAGESPYTGVWYVTGKVYFKDDAVINGTVVSEDEVHFDNTGSSCTITATPAKYPAILTKKKIFVTNDDVTLNGFVYSDLHIHFEGDDLNATGAIVAGQRMHKESGTSKVFTYEATYLVNLTGVTFDLTSSDVLQVLTWERL